MHLTNGDHQFEHSSSHSPAPSERVWNRVA
jgi:hypothetical protein